MNEPVKKQRSTLVVGTTPDYIDWIRKVEPGRNIFLTDPFIRQKALEASPLPQEEILCDLTDYQLAACRIKEHLEYYSYKLDGITAFDCESMELAAYLARQYALSYPSSASIHFCRDKYLAKRRWRENGLFCPAAKLVNKVNDAEDFLKYLASPVILKPQSGSGSEYVYRCASAEECRANYEIIRTALANQQTNRLYHQSAASAKTPIMAEEFVDGEEYSCDFMIDCGHIRIIRLTKKIRAHAKPFGTTHGYVLGKQLFPPAFDMDAFLETLRASAASLQIGRGICMLDFIIQNGKAVLLEIAPRPGGDCLPWLLRRACGLDILKLTLAFARREEAILMDFAEPDDRYLGMRILAHREGRLRKIDFGSIKNDRRILETGLTRKPGHIIVLPPADFDSWILGYVIAVLEPGEDPQSRLLDIDRKINIVVDAV